MIRANCDVYAPFAFTIVDGPSTMVVDGTRVMVLAWHDNEWGYVNRMVDLAQKVAATL